MARQRLGNRGEELWTGVSAFDPAKAAAELAWLQANPHFYERPASILEFLGPGYLDIDEGVRPGVKAELLELFGDETNPHRIARYRWGMFTGAIGIGKTTMASIVLPYMAHWVMCLHDPQKYFGLLPGTKIAFMQMSTSEDQAVETVFGDIKSRIEYSEWFSQEYPYDPNYKKQLRFPQKNVWILPGNSAETTFEGYNILGGILDEADSHKVTKDKDYADVGFDTINSRVGSRFQDRGFLLVVGQMKKANGFAAKKYKEFTANPQAHTVRMTIWESMGWDHPTYQKKDGSGVDYFWYDSKRKEIVPTGAAELVAADSETLIKVPTVYREDFESNPEKALRDLAGIPPATGDPFISLTYKLDEAVARWQARYDGVGSPVNSTPVRPKFEEWFRALNGLKRVAHIDIAVSAKGDALGLAMGHVAEVVEVEGEMKPVIVFDFLMRIKAAPGTEIFLSDIRRIIYDLKDEQKFKLTRVTMDGFQSTDTFQQLRKKKFDATYLSVDKSKLPYEDLRDAIYENRIEWPPYETYLEVGGTEKVLIANKELMELEDVGNKIDHPTNGSKDVADAMAGVVTTLMGDRQYRRGVASRSYGDVDKSAQPDPNGGKALDDLFGAGGGGMHAPIPPASYPGGSNTSSLSMPIPPRLTGR